jgi:hypothetical protein
VIPIVISDQLTKVVKFRASIYNENLCSQMPTIEYLNVSSANRIFRILGRKQNLPGVKTTIQENPSVHLAVVHFRHEIDLDVDQA